MTIPLGEPAKIGDADVRLGFWGIPRNPGDPVRSGGTFTIINGEGELTLDVFIGPKGDPGENAPIFRWQYDSTVENIGDLPNVATLDESDDGRGWLIGTTWYVYVHEAGEYKSVDSGIPGPTGLTPDIDITAELVPSDPDDRTIVVTESGPTHAKNFHLEIPEEVLRGPEGPSTAIRLAPDYDDTYPPLDGQGIVWDDASERFKPGDLSPTAVKMFTIPHSSFTDFSGDTPRQLIGYLDIEPQPVAWYPDVLGHVRWVRTFLSSAEVEVEVRIGDTGDGTGETAPLCGLAPYDPSMLDAVTVANIFPHFSDVGQPTRSVHPDLATGRVPIGQAKTIYVFLHKIGGIFGYQFTKEYAQLRINLNPVS